MTIDTSRAAVERVLDGVTGAPWSENCGDVYDADGLPIAQLRIGKARTARFIAWCREGVPALLAAKEAAEARFAEWQGSQSYRYIGRDGKTVLARDLEDRAEAAEAALAAMTRERDAERETVARLTGVLRKAETQLVALYAVIAPNSEGRFADNDEAVQEIRAALTQKDRTDG